MIRIADHRLVEIPDLHVNLAVGSRQRPQVSRVAIAANPDRRPFRHGALASPLEPSVELYRAAADVGMRGARHLQIAPRAQSAQPLRRRDGEFGFAHDVLWQKFMVAHALAVIS